MGHRKLKTAIVIGGAKLVGRAIAGHDLRGGRKTDATFTRRGTTSTTTGRVKRRDHLPGWRRTAHRAGGLVAVAATGGGLLLDPAAVAATAQIGTYGGIVGGVYVIGEKTYRYSHHRQYVQPLSEQLGHRVGWPPDVAATSWIDVPHGHREDPDKVTIIRFPTGLALTEAKKKEILAIARPVLGLHGSDPQWYEGADAKLELRACPAPPDFVDLEKVRALVEAARWNQPLLGLAARSVPHSISYASDSPHVLASLGSGGGKSTFVKAIAAPFRRDGGRVFVIDIVKRGASAKWAKHVEGIEVVRTAARAHELLVALAEEVSVRCERAYDTDDLPDVTPILLVIEEANATQGVLQRYWTEELEEKKTSPAISALADVLCVGREALTHVLLVAQQANARTTGGGAARENFGVRVLSRFSRNTAKMLVPELGPHLRSSKHPGRVQVAVGGEATEVQVLFLTDAQAGELATTGKPAGPLSETLLGFSPAQRPSVDNGDTGTGRVLELVPRAHSPLADEPELPEADPLVSLAEAADGMVVGETHEALKKARSRARAEGEPFPPVAGKKGRTELFRPAELRAWALNRPGPGALAGASSRGGGAS